MPESNHNITQRDICFDFSDVDMNHWHPAGFHVSHYLNVQSLMFPQGERFFIRSVRHFRGEISDPQLSDDIAGFIAQEAVHGREHEAYNAELSAIGYPARKADRLLEWYLRLLEDKLSPETCLAVTAGMEHFTAITADSLLGDPRSLEGAHPTMAKLWRWHSLEETEHKAVAMDVFRTVSGNRLVAWLRRCITFLLSTFGIQCCIWYMLIATAHRSGKLFDFRGWFSLVKYLWLKPGVYRKQIPSWLRYFLPGFHPWDINSRAELEQWQAELRD